MSSNSNYGIIHKTDIVKFQRQCLAPLRDEKISETLERAAERYMKIRADIILLEAEKEAIVSHIRSFEDWEYFLDAFSDIYQPDVPYEKFNSVSVYSVRDEGGYGKDIVCLEYDERGCGATKSAKCVTFGCCTFKDLLDIESIITERKRYYETDDSGTDCCRTIYGGAEA